LGATAMMLSELKDVLNQFYMLKNEEISGERNSLIEFIIHMAI
jgi:hypothetical protein